MLKVSKYYHKEKHRTEYRGSKVLVQEWNIGEVIQSVVLNVVVSIDIIQIVTFE